MSDLLNWITAVSLLALAGVLFYCDYKAGSAKGFILHTIILVACVAFLWRFYDFLRTASVGKGDNSEVYFIIVLYVIMVLGMRQPTYDLRKKSKTLSEDDAKKMLKKYDYYSTYEYSWSKPYSNPQGQGIDNEFSVQMNGKVVYDAATGLSWHSLVLRTI